MSSVVLGGIIFSAAGLVLLARRMEWGLYLLAATAFFSGWHLVFENEMLRAFFSLPFFASFVTAPLVDFVALAVCISFVLALISGMQRINAKQARAMVPALVLFGFFILAAMVSAWFVYHHQQFSSFKYVLRPLAFAFGCFFAIPFLLLQRREHLMKLLWVWFFVGLVVVVYGLSSFIFASDHWLWVTPYPIAGFAPLGDNHNQIAEMLLAIIPLSCIIYFSNRKKSFAPYILFGITITIAVALLTLSRTLWLVFGLQALMVTYWYRVPLFKFAGQIDRRWWFMVGAAALGIIVYMAVYLSSAVPVSSSNSRSLMTALAIDATMNAPLFGNGPGTYITLMQETPAYVRAFSVQLDAHGFVQKILLEQGLVGLLSWLAFMGWLLWYMYGAVKVSRSKEQLMAARFFLLTACGVLAFQLFNTSYYLATMWMPLSVCFAGATLLRQKTW